MNNRLDRPVDGKHDHMLGPHNAPITLVEYRSYDCPYCRATNERIAQVRGQFGDRLRSDAILSPLEYRLRPAALSFASWAPSTGVLLPLASVLSVALTNSVLGPSVDAFWHMDIGFTFPACMRMAYTPPWPVSYWRRSSRRGRRRTLKRW